MRLTAWEEFELRLTMSFDGYRDYILGETNVEAAIVAGMSEAEARRICAESFGPLFEVGDREVRFRAVFTVAQKTAAADNLRATTP